MLANANWLQPLHDALQKGCYSHCIRYGTIMISSPAHHFLASALQTSNELTGRFVGMVCAEAPVLITCPVHLGPV